LTDYAQKSPQTVIAVATSVVWRLNQLEWLVQLAAM
jgi:hypothetical protein